MKKQPTRRNMTLLTQVTSYANGWVQHPGIGKVYGYHMHTIRRLWAHDEFPDQPLTELVTYTIFEGKQISQHVNWTRKGRGTAPLAYWIKELRKQRAIGHAVK